MNKLLLTIFLLISTSVTATYSDGRFITKEVDRLTIITNASQESGYQFISVFVEPWGQSVLSLSCAGLCEFYSTKTHIPKIDGFDGMLWSEENAAQGDGRWIESVGVVSLHTKNTPTFSIPGKPNKFIGIIQDVAGSSGLGSYTLYLIDTVTGAFGVKELQWGENEWGNNVEFTSLNTVKEADSCFLCIW